MNNFLDNKSVTASTVYLLLFIVLTLRVGGAVSHYCFDGLEPLVTVHFDNLSGHIEHDDKLGHTDVEKQVLSDNLLSKLFELESVLVIISLFLISQLPRSGNPAYSQLATQLSSDRRAFLPPQRAPPKAS